MSDQLHSVEPATLVAHHACVRRLARRLVLDEAEADDVVQEAWLKALERPPSQPESLRAWLATVVRNAAKQLARSESRRRRREIAVARPEGLPSTGELVARAEARRILNDAVLALDEPFRSTLLLRFFEGLPPREIARLQGVPVETVRSRVRRGLAHARTHLDAQHGGRRRTWAMALVPLAGPALPGAPAPPTSHAPPPTTPTGAVGTIAAALVLATVGGVAGWALPGGPPDDTALRADLAAERAATSRVREATAAAQRRIADTADRLAALRSPPPVATATPEATAAHESATEQAGGTRPRFAFPRFARILDTVDWDRAGRAFGALLGAMEPFLEPVLAGRPPTPTVVGEVQVRAAPVTELAMRLYAEGIPGALPNAVLAHPAVLANLLPGALRELGAPFSRTQEVALERLAREGSDRLEQRRVDESAPYLRRVADDAAALSPWLASIDALLTARQREVLRPATFRDRAGLDLVSPGLLWPTMSVGVHIAGRGDYAREVEATLIAPVFPDGTQERAAAQEVLAAWITGLPDAAFTGPDGPADAFGFVSYQRAASWTSRLADLVERLQSDAAGTAWQRAQLGRTHLVRVPVIAEVSPR